MNRAKRLGVIASHGSLDAAYPPLILSTTAVAMGMEAAVFFTFFGLEIVRRERRLKVAANADPAMQGPLPNLVAVLPGMTAAATGAMRRRLDAAGTASVDELLDLAVETGVRLIACEMTMGVLGVDRADLLDAVEIGGAATFLDYVADDAITLSF